MIEYLQLQRSVGPNIGCISSIYRQWFNWVNWVMTWLAVNVEFLLRKESTTTQNYHMMINWIIREVLPNNSSHQIANAPHGSRRICIRNATWNATWRRGRHKAPFHSVKSKPQSHTGHGKYITEQSSGAGPVDRSSASEDKFKCIQSGIWCY